MQTIMLIAMTTILAMVRFSTSPSSVPVCSALLASMLGRC